MNQAILSNEDLNKRIRNTQSRIAKLAGFQESQRQVIAQAKEQAVKLFGTDDIIEIKAQIKRIEERNAKVIAFKTRAEMICSNILGYMENNQPIPEQLLADLEKAIDTSSKHVPAQA
jgi:TolA-binding protein